jgi:hypothetical protein
MSYLHQSELTGYAAEDWNAIDYQMWRQNGAGPPMRGPQLDDLRHRSYIVALGAAQTFGRFCSHPYPALLSAKLGFPVLNLGFDGAGPKQFCRPGLLQLINNAALVIVQVMSGRSLSNSVFECPNDGGTLKRRDKPDSEPVFALTAWREWMNEIDAKYATNQPEKIRVIRSLMLESRVRWVGEMAFLAEQITVPTVLFWFSRRPPDYQESYNHPEHVFGDFPQLIDGRTFRAALPLFDEACLSVSARGCPQPVFNRFTGEPHAISPHYRTPTENSYYPSPEMQQDAAADLYPVIARLLAGQRLRDDAISPAPAAQASPIGHSSV